MKTLHQSLKDFYLSEYDLFEQDNCAYGYDRMFYVQREVKHLLLQAELLTEPCTIEWSGDQLILISPDYPMTQNLSQ